MQLFWAWDAAVAEYSSSGLQAQQDVDETTEKYGTWQSSGGMNAG